MPIISRWNRWCVAGGVILVLFIFKALWVTWACYGQGEIETEKDDLLQRRDYLATKLIQRPQDVIEELPSIIGEQFQGEWALYSCSMFSQALVNLSKLYPETKEENLQMIDSLITIVKSEELRCYDSIRWEEDAMQALGHSTGHISYYSHLAWMIGGYKSIGGGSRYDELYDKLCEAMSKNIRNSKIMNLPTYPGEFIYVPDMLVAIVALKQYGKKYDTLVKDWIKKAKAEWCDKETGLLSSFLAEKTGGQCGAPIKGSYSALNCYYLTLIDKTFAEDQYDKLKKTFWQEGIFPGMKEYQNRHLWFWLDVDAGPIMFGLSPSGTAFATGAATYFRDKEAKADILRTTETAGFTYCWNGKRHYMLANIALVGESIMLAMRTNY